MHGSQAHTAQVTKLNILKGKKWTVSSEGITPEPWAVICLMTIIRANSWETTFPPPRGTPLERWDSGNFPVRCASVPETYSKAFLVSTWIHRLWSLGESQCCSSDVKCSPQAHMSESWDLSGGSGDSGLQLYSLALSPDLTRWPVHCLCCHLATHVCTFCDMMDCSPPNHGSK